MRQSRIVSFEDRKGHLTFRIEEMPASRLESWLLRAVTLMQVGKSAGEQVEAGGNAWSETEKAMIMAGNSAWSQVALASQFTEYTLALTTPGVCAETAPSIFGDLFIGVQEEGVSPFSAARRLLSCGIAEMFSVDCDKAEVLMEEMLRCCFLVREDGRELRCNGGNIDEILEDARTLMRLRGEALRINLGCYAQGRAA